MNKNLIIGGVLLAAVAGGYLVADARKTPATVTVVGEGKVDVKPEEFYLIVTKVNTGNDASKVIDDGDTEVKRLMDVARRLGGDSAEIKKSFYQVTPQGDGTYIIANAFSVKSSKVEAVNALIKELYASGATTISNATFNTKNQVETDQNARIEAVKDAKAKAEKIAKSANKRVGRIMSIADDNASGTSSVGEAGVSGLSNITITKNVSVVYEIK